MTNPFTPSDDHNPYLDALRDQVGKRLGQVAYNATRAVFDADGFRWNNNASRTAIACHFRQQDTADDFTDGLTRVICAVYTEHDFPHDPGTVRQAVTRQLEGGPHGTSGK